MLEQSLDVKARTAIMRPEGNETRTPMPHGDICVH